MKIRPPIHLKKGTAAPHRDDIPKLMLKVIEQAYAQPFSIQSNYARANAFFVASAASLGYITTKSSARGGTYGSLWRPTKAGLHFLEKE